MKFDTLLDSLFSEDFIRECEEEYENVAFFVRRQERGDEWPTIE